MMGDYSSISGDLELVNMFPSLCSQDSSQIELLKELMDLQKDMVVMLLSMLEGTFKTSV